MNMLYPYGYAESLSDWTPCVSRVSRDKYVFELRAAHLALLESAAWEWDDNFSPGAPVVDTKRPFGNSGAWRVPRDIYAVIDDHDPGTLADIGISENFLDREKDDDNDVQALNGLWTECMLAVSVLLHCARSGLTAKPGSKWVIGPNDTWSSHPG